HLNMQGNLFKSQLFLIKIQELHLYWQVKGLGMDALMPHAPRTSTACGSEHERQKSRRDF
ncbi:MAG TPA: hypothetical protein PK467_20220, partial [Candidatus Wallbacteria bacterium]|nr:hypothetical protein [Candidatus Wallbacteria bacterium]